MRTPRPRPITSDSEGLDGTGDFVFLSSQVMLLAHSPLYVLQLLRRFEIMKGKCIRPSGLIHLAKHRILRIKPSSL